MKVKELIRELYKCNLENQVLIVSSESGSFNIDGVFEDADVVYIEGE